MWRAVVISHVFIAVCMFLVAIVVYWAYGDKVCQNPTLVYIIIIAFMCLNFNINSYI